MARKGKAFTVKPADGGKLISNLSREDVGLANYVTKRDFRRQFGDEVFREGHDYFWPNTTNDGVTDFRTNPGNQPFPNNATLRTVSGITRVTTTATATTSADHGFVVGESVLVAGSSQTEYNVKATIVSVPSSVTFTYLVSGSPTTPATGTMNVKSDEDVTLIHQAQRADGRKAVIVGTATTLFRFFALDNGNYYEGNGTASAYFYADDTADPGPVDPAGYPYFDDSPGEWIIIGRGYRPSANRWQAVDLAGLAVFNNGYDLPVSYDVTDLEVYPLYEMREAGIASVGVINEVNSVLGCLDITEIVDEKIEEHFRRIGIYDSESTLASQSGTTVTSTSDFFVAGDVGKYIIYDTGEEAKITVWTDTQTVTVDTSQTVTNKEFTLRVKAAQAGSEYSNLVTGNYTFSNDVVIISLAMPTTVVVGDTLRFTNGFSSVIATVTSQTNFTLTAADNPGVNFTGLPFWIISSTGDDVVVASNGIFTSAMVGREIYWDDGITRKITAYTNATTVIVDQDLTVASKYFSIENPDTYGEYTQTAFTNRRQYRALWSDISKPRRFSSIVPGSITKNSNKLILKYPAKSFVIGQEIIILGAGESGGNLTANIIYISASRNITLDTKAANTVANVDISQSDAIGSFVKFEDLEGDTSPIVNAGVLHDKWIIYKDSHYIFIGTFTGNVTSPFSFKRIRIDKGKGLYYRDSLALVDNEQHVYAGRNGFYSFDLTNQNPRQVDVPELVKDIFLDQVNITQTNQVFTVHNSITKEVMMVFPSSSSDKALVFDDKWGTASTTSGLFTAGGVIKRPEVGSSVGVTEDWLVLAKGGVILLYGKTEKNVDSWVDPDNSSLRLKEIYYRREANPFSVTKTTYQGVLESGSSALGDEFNEKDLISHVLHLSSRSSETNITLEILGDHNSAQGMTVLDTITITNADTQSLTPLFRRRIHFADRITVTSVEKKPVKISGRTFEAKKIKSRSATRV